VYVCALFYWKAPFVSVGFGNDSSRPEDDKTHNLARISCSAPVVLTGVSEVVLRKRKTLVEIKAKRQAQQKPKVCLTFTTRRPFTSRAPMSCSQLDCARQCKRLTSHITNETILLHRTGSQEEDYL
jgi:hypothetical protein